MWRTAVGLGLLAVIGNAIDRLQISTFWALIVTGAVLVVALALDSFGKRRLAWVGQAFSDAETEQP
jgi:ribose transport system permease protein/inositol transport system permease protein